jgi:hypothetical protein
VLSFQYIHGGNIPDATMAAIQAQIIDLRRAFTVRAYHAKLIDFSDGK